MAKTKETECTAKHSKRSKTSDNNNPPADLVSSQDSHLEERKSMGLEDSLNVPDASFSDNGGRSKEVNKQLDFEDISWYKLARMYVLVHLLTLLFYVSGTRKKSRLQSVQVWRGEYISVFKLNHAVSN